MALCIAGIMISLIKIVAWLILNLGVDEFVAVVAVDIFCVINTRTRKTIFVDSISLDYLVIKVNVRTVLLEFLFIA